MTLRPGLYAQQLRDLPHDLRWGRRHHTVWAELRRRTLDQVYERGRFTVVEHDLDELRDVPPPRGVIIRPLEGGYDALADLAPRRTLVALERRETCTCLVAWSGDRPLGYDCWSERLHPELDLLPTPLPPDTAFGHDLFVAASARDVGIGTALAAARLAACRDHGYRRLRRLIANENAASWRTAEGSAPSESVGEVWFVKTPGRLRTGFEPA
jgi:GNAT superfamily N-acetyltransferase